MGERETTRFRTTFNRSVQVESRPEAVTANAGLLSVREVDERLGISALVAASIVDPRAPKRRRHSVAELLRTRMYGEIAGFSSQRDIDHLRDDPVMRLSTADGRGCKAGDRYELPSQPSLNRLHRMLGTEENLPKLEGAVTEAAIRSMKAVRGTFSGERTIDLDSTTIDTHGEQPGSVWNGHYRKKCMHPLIAISAETGDILGARLRPGNEASSTGARDFLEGILDRTNEAGLRFQWVRGDAGFTSEGMMSFLQDRGLSYVFRLPKTKPLQLLAEPHLKRPAGRRPKEPREWVHEFTYKAGAWSRARRVLLVVQEHADDLFLHHYFLVTNEWAMSPEEVVEHYRQRGTMEGRLGEWKSTFEPKLSCSTRTKDASDEEKAAAFRANASTFLVQVLADGLLHTLRRMLGLAFSCDGMSRPSLMRVRRLLIQVAGRVCRSARRWTLVIPTRAAEVWNYLGRRLDRLLPVA